MLQKMRVDNYHPHIVIQVNDEQDVDHRAWDETATFAKKFFSATAGICLVFFGGSFIVESQPSLNNLFRRVEPLFSYSSLPSSLALAFTTSTSFEAFAGGFIFSTAITLLGLAIIKQ